MAGIGVVRNIKIASRMSVIGYDDLPYAAQMSPLLTAIRRPLTEIGRMASLLLRLIEGDALEATFRGATSTMHAGETITFPANAPHECHNRSAQPARLQCICATSGQEAFFHAIGVPVATRTTPPRCWTQRQTRTSWPGFKRWPHCTGRNCSRLVGRLRRRRC